MVIVALAVAVIRLTPAEAEAARADGEARAVAMYAREDAAATAKRRPGRGFLGLDLGGVQPARAHAPLGDTGGADFVYPAGSIGRRRYRDN